MCGGVFRGSWEHQKKLCITPEIIKVFLRGQRKIPVALNELSRTPYTHFK